MPQNVEGKVNVQNLLFCVLATQWHAEDVWTPGPQHRLRCGWRPNMRHIASGLEGRCFQQIQQVNQVSW
jgi:hypothetical protein